MASRTGRLSQDQNLGLYIDGESSFRGQKKTGKAAVRKPIGEASFRGQKKTVKASVRKPIGEASFRGQKKTGGAGVRKVFGDSPNSGEPNIINQPGGKKAQDGLLISGKQLKSEKLASVKEEAVPSNDENLDSKRIASKVPEKPQTSNTKALSDIAYSKLMELKTKINWTKGDLDEYFCDDYDDEKCSESSSPRCLCEIDNNPRKEESGSPTINGIMPERFEIEIDPDFWVVKPFQKF